MRQRKGETHSNMINWKIFVMMSYVDKKGRLVPMVTATHEETVQDSDSREEAFDEFDAFCGIAKMKLAEPGMAFTATLTEYEHMEDEDGKLLATVHIVRGYREGGKDKKTGEIRYERDDDDTERTPVYTRYERYWVKE